MHFQYVFVAFSGVALVTYITQQPGCPGLDSRWPALKISSLNWVRTPFTRSFMPLRHACASVGLNEQTNAKSLGLHEGWFHGQHCSGHVAATHQTPCFCQHMPLPLVQANSTYKVELELAPAGVIRYSTTDRSAALGIDLLRREDRRDDTLRAVQANTTTLMGPYKLLQGGSGFGEEPFITNAA